MAGFSIYVSNTTSKDQGHLCFYDQSSGHPSVNQRIICSIYGRYVIYYNERSRYNNPSYMSMYAFNELCEVEVYGEYVYILAFCVVVCSGNTLCNKTMHLDFFYSKCVKFGFKSD